jgi:hypothetical protein
MPRKGLRQIKEQIRAKNYEVTGHAEEEREDEDVEIADIERAILTGKVEQVLTGDPRGVRYVVGGKARDGRKLEIVCRFLSSGKLRIITVYVRSEE